jgi:hypothetical protein
MTPHARFAAEDLPSIGLSMNEAGNGSPPCYMSRSGDALLRNATDDEFDLTVESE